MTMDFFNLTTHESNIIQIHPYMVLIMYIYILYSPRSFMILPHSLPIFHVSNAIRLAFHHLSHDARAALQKNEASPGKGAAKQ
jgi:hypothetical protein